MTIERARTRPLPGPDHVVPKQVLENEAAATGRPQQNPGFRSTHYASVRTITEWDRLGVPLNRKSDAYGHTFGAGAQDNADARRRVGNGHAELIRLLGNGPESSIAREVHEVRREHMGEAATKGNAIHSDLRTLWKLGGATKFAITKSFQTWALSGAMPKRVTLNLSADVEPMAGGTAVRTVPVATVPIPSFGAWDPVAAFIGGQVAKEGFNLVHDFVQPKYFTGIGAKRDDMEVLAEKFRANAARAKEIRAGSAGAGIVKAFGEGGRDHLEDTMINADHANYARMKAMQRQTRRATEPEQHLILTGVDAAATQATLCNFAEADFLTRFAGRSEGTWPVVHYWQPPDHPEVGYVSVATDPLTGTPPPGARARKDVSEAERPQRWDYRPDPGALLAEVGKALGQIPSWDDYALAQANLVLAKSGRRAAWVQLGEMCEAGRLGIAQGTASRRMAQQLYEIPARQDDRQAQYRLGRILAEGGAGGSTGPESDRLAVEWLQKAADQGHPEAAAELGLMHAANRTGLDKQTSGSQACFWLRKAIRGGVHSAEVVFTLGLMHEEHRADVGVGDEANRLAEQWYLEAAKLRHPEANLRLGLLHYRHTPGLAGGTGNDANAAKYLGIAKDLGNAEAAYYLAHMYRDGRAHPEGDTLRKEAILACLEQAAGAGHLKARVLLGRMLAAGELEPRSGETAGQAAARWLLPAARRGDDVEVQCDLADLYRHKKAQPEDGQSHGAAAEYWYRKAEALGSERARKALNKKRDADLAASVDRHSRGTATPVRAATSGTPQ